MQKLQSWRSMEISLLVSSMCSSLLVRSYLGLPSHCGGGGQQSSVIIIGIVPLSDTLPPCGHELHSSSFASIWYLLWHKQCMYSIINHRIPPPQNLLHLSCWDVGVSNYKINTSVAWLFSILSGWCWSSFLSHVYGYFARDSPP